MAELPSEIWWTILRKATTFDGLHIIHDPFRDWKQSEAYRRSHCNPPTASKRRAVFVRVCRAWYEIGIEFLYEDIAIYSVTQLSQLAKTIEFGKIVINRRRPGWWTRRLHLFEMEVDSAEKERRQQDDLAKILARIPNLVHFFDDGIFGPNRKPLDSNCAAVVISSIPGSRSALGSLDLRGREINIEAMCRFLRELPNLELLKLVQVRSRKSKSQNQNQNYGLPIRLSRLRTLVVDSPHESKKLMSLISSWNLPVVSTLVIIGHDVPHVDQVLRTHGRKLRTLVLSMVMTSSALGPSLNSCSQLQHLIISLYLEISPKVLNNLGPTLVRVGIEDMEEFSDPEMVEYFPALYGQLDGLLSTLLGSGFPKLQSVMAVKTTSAEILTAIKLSPDRLEKWLPIFASKKVRFEDGAGYPIQILRSRR